METSLNSNKAAVAWASATQVAAVSLGFASSVIPATWGIAGAWLSATAFVLGAPGWILAAGITLESPFKDMASFCLFLPANFVGWLALHAWLSTSLRQCRP
ncbi:MAG TPA: hypothetical protein VEH27_05550 [Methylomirabilota bacterium]|nr:hypothetical protein [Methylomirabilota bacterium]